MSPALMINVDVSILMKKRLFNRRCTDMDTKFQQFSPHLKVKQFRTMS